MTIVVARAPKRIRRKQPAEPPAVIIDKRKRPATPFDAEEHHRRGHAADALWRELVRRVAEG